MGEPLRTDAEVARQLRGLQAVERIREALEDRFEVEVRESVLAGGAFAVEELHDYLTGVADGREPRVRLLFELHERGALDLTGTLADVPATCFFLGETARYERSLDDWLALFGPARRYHRRTDDPQMLELWSAGDLTWGRSRKRATDAAAFLSVYVDRPVGLWRALVRPQELWIAASDRWSGREEGRVIVPPGLLPAEQAVPGATVPTDRPLTPRPRIIDAL